MRKVVIGVEIPDNNIAEMKKQYPDFAFIVCRDKEELFQNLGDAEILITFQFTREMAEAAPKLKWIQVVSAGVDTLPLDYIKQHGIILTNGRGIHKIHMSEYAIAAMIELSRNFQTMLKNQSERKWDPNVQQGEIYGATLGIVGLGSIGAEIAKKASLMGMKVIGVKRNPTEMEYVDKIYPMEKIDEVFKKSDYVINLLPSTPETHRIINRDYFNIMKVSACFINIGRGKTVDEEDLIDALKNKRFRAMVSDVFYEEPLPENSPLWNMDNVIITPHICGISPKYSERALEIIINNFNAYINNKQDMINLVNLDSGY